MLSRFNAQGLRVTATRFFPHQPSEQPLPSTPANSPSGINTDAELWFRARPMLDMVKVVVHHHRVVGAVLIGDTGLEETMENLILNGTNVSHVGLRLLDPDVDIEDYFD